MRLAGKADALLPGIREENRNMIILAAVAAGILLDLLFGDPACIPHPVVIIGKAISGLEKFLRDHFPKTKSGERQAGVFLACMIPAGTMMITTAACLVAWLIHPAVFFAIETFWCWQSLAIKGLYTESMNVCRCLQKKDLPAARKAVARIVGRDTENLTEEGVTKAAVETVAENFSDGVFAPLFYMVIGGAPMALVYKSINTMDSMVGYKNEKYRYFGTAAARLDDAANLIPSRVAAVFWILAAAVTGNHPGDAFRIWRRDRRNHASPNSAQTESACAGALGVQLAGGAWYFGEYYEKPTIGDALRPIEPEDIRRTNRMMLAASFLSAAVCLLVRWLLVLCFTR